MIGGDRCFPIRCVQCCALVSAACNTMSFSLSLGLDSLYQTMRLYVKHVCSCLCIQRSASFQYSDMPHGSLLDNRIERGEILVWLTTDKFMWLRRLLHSSPPLPLFLYLFLIRMSIDFELDDEKN